MVGQTKVFVGSLPQGSKPEELRKLFERFGVVTECDIMNRCGFVHMQTEEQAAAAIRDLNNSTFNGGVITVEKGRIKDRGGPRGGGRGGMRGGLRDDRRGGMRSGPPRDSPYPPVRDRGMGGPPMRGPPMGGGMPIRNGGGYDRGMDRVPMSGGYDDRYNGYGGEDRRGFALMDNHSRDPYAAQLPMYQDDRKPYAAPVDDLVSMYPDERDMMDRRPPVRTTFPMAVPSGYERAAPPRAAPTGNGEMYSRRAEPTMRTAAAAPAGYDHDPYAQQYPPMGRYWVQPG